MSKMEGMEKKLSGITKTLAVIVIAAIVILAAVVGAYWWFFLREVGPKLGITLSVSPAPTGVEDSGGYAKPGESITISGSTSPVVANATVTLTYTEPDSNLTRAELGTPLRSNYTRTTTTDGNGKFTDTYSSNVTGKWTVTAEIRGETSDPAAFYIFTGDPIKIGVIRNLVMMGQCMEEASRMAVDEINDAGGILGHKVILAFGDEGTEPTRGVAEMTRLITVEQVDFVEGGYRSDIIFPMREVAMDHKIIFIMDAATTELLNCEGSTTIPTPCGKCVKCNYARYKYLFRILPPNSSAVFMGTLIPFLTGYVVPLLGGSEDSPVKVAGVIENLVWTDVLDSVFRKVFPLVFGSSMSLVRYYRPSSTETNFETILTGIRDSGAKLIIHVLSGEAGLSFIKQWGEMQIPAIPVGVNVLSQGSEMWDLTDGKCEYETIMSTSVRVPITEKTIPFWDRYVERWEHHPLFTGLGSYMAMYTLAEAIERAGTIESDAVVAELEKTNRISIMGRFTYTQYHDLYVPKAYDVDEEGNYHWISTEYTQPMMVQWRKPGEPVVVYPFDKPYSKDLELPHWMQSSNPLQHP